MQSPVFSQLLTMGYLPETIIAMYSLILCPTAPLMSNHVTKNSNVLLVSFELTLYVL